MGHIRSEKYVHKCVRFSDTPKPKVMLNFSYLLKIGFDDPTRTVLMTLLRDYDTPVLEVLRSVYPHVGGFMITFPMGSDNPIGFFGKFCQRRMAH